MAFGFQSGAFQQGAFQQSGSTAPTPDTSTGGWAVPEPRSSADRHRERLARMGLTQAPKPVRKAVRKLAREVVAQAQGDPLAWLEAHHAQQRAAMQAALEEQQQRYRYIYMVLLQLEVERLIQDEEDEQIVRLLMEM